MYIYWNIAIYTSVLNAKIIKITLEQVISIFDCVSKNILYVAYFWAQQVNVSLTYSQAVITQETRLLCKLCRNILFI